MFLCIEQLKPKCLTNSGKEVSLGVNYYVAGGSRSLGLNLQMDLSTGTLNE